jgi:23S rRNA U2552 (ribose-2'-O)-methylase RlmE/FtsJ
MLHTQLPNVPSSIIQYICCVYASEIHPVYSVSLSYYLTDIKQNIPDEWDTYKKYTNPYEFINTYIPRKSKCVATYKPLSRAYFKMIEVMTAFKLCDYPRPICSFHLAEGPGGFIEALAQSRKNTRDVYVGMTILDDNVGNWDIPAWKKSATFLRNNPNVFIENGITGTGDILSVANFEYCVGKYGSSMDIITGDGGFDFSIDFENQETNIARLLFGQICYALCLQRKGGKFVLKIFDCFMAHTVDLLYILSAFYKNVYITKPKTSRYANSEKYVVCEGFLFDNSSLFFPQLRLCLDNAVRNILTIQRFLTIPIPINFTNRIEEYNAIVGQQQLENIHQTLLLIQANKNDKLEHLIQTNVKKCISWCVAHNVPHQEGTYGSLPNPPLREQGGCIAPSSHPQFYGDAVNRGSIPPAVIELRPPPGFEIRREPMEQGGRRGDGRPPAKCVLTYTPS